MVIVDDFFHDSSVEVEERGEEYPTPLFKCTASQINYACKAGVSRDFIFDAVCRSSVSAGYDTIQSHMVCWIGNVPEKKYATYQITISSKMPMYVYMNVVIAL